MPFAHNMQPGSLELAYLVDTIYDLYVRRALVLRGGKVHELHRKAVAHVCAHAQSEALAHIEGELTEEEAAVVRRGRNAHQSPPKHADPAEYHRATSFDALIGWLYLNGREARRDAILRRALADLYTEETHEE